MVDVAGQLAERGVDPWVWPSRVRRKEEFITTALWQLFDPVEHPELAQAAVSALAAAAGTPTAPWTRVPLWGFEPKGSRYRPDLCLIDADDVVRVVVEVKRGGPSQYTAVTTVARHERFPDAASRALPDLAELGLLERHPHTDWSCGCTFHTQRRDGHVRAALPQIDGYRHFAG